MMAELIRATFSDPGWAFTKGQRDEDIKGLPTPHACCRHPAYFEELAWARKRQPK